MSHRLVINIHLWTLTLLLERRLPERCPSGITLLDFDGGYLWMGSQDWRKLAWEWRLVLEMVGPILLYKCDVLWDPVRVLPRVGLLPLWQRNCRCFSRVELTQRGKDVVAFQIRGSPADKCLGWPSLDAQMLGA